MTTVHDATLAILLLLFDDPVMLNTVRSDYVEVQVGVLLGDRWRHVGQWDGWDYETGDGAELVRLEVKAGAAKQVWEQKAPSVCSFDVKPRTGYFRAGAEWVEGVGRNADLYVLAWHDRYDDADQRDEGQWIYYVVATTKLPDSQRVGLARLDALVHEERAKCVGASDLRGAVEAVALEVLTRRRDAPR